MDVVGRRLPAHEDDGRAGLAAALRGIRIEHDLAHARTRRGIESRGQQVARRSGIDRWVQKLVELLGIDPLHGLLARDHTLLHHVARHAHTGSSRALAIAGLEQIERSLLDRKFDVLHVAVVRLEARHRGDQFGVGLGQLVLELGQLAWRANPRNDVLALCVDQELAVQLFDTCRRVAGKTDACA